MAKKPQSHISILRRGVNHWNEWRQLNPDIIPMLDGAELRGADLQGAILSNANMRWANLTGANLQGAILYQTEFYQSCLRKCDLSDTDMRGAKLHDANLIKAVFNGTNLFRCDFINTNLSGASLAGSFCGTTAFSNVDLSVVKGLDKVKHTGPSNIDLLTISRSKGLLPNKFLSDAGVPDSLLKVIGKFTPDVDGPLYYSCFISYNHNDVSFTTKLWESLRAANVPVWYAPENIKPGIKIIEQIQGAIQTHDKILVVLSSYSMKSEWVMTELRNAHKREHKEKIHILLPISLASEEKVKKWKCFDADIGKDIAVEIREYHIPDFTQWKDDTKFRPLFKKLLNSLKIKKSTLKQMSESEQPNNRS